LHRSTPRTTTPSSGIPQRCVTRPRRAARAREVYGYVSSDRMVLERECIEKQANPHPGTASVLDARATFAGERGGVARACPHHFELGPQVGESRPRDGRNQSRLASSVLAVRIVHNSRPVILLSPRGRQDSGHRSYLLVRRRSGAGRRAHEAASTHIARMASDFVDRDHGLHEVRSLELALMAGEGPVERGVTAGLQGPTRQWTCPAGTDAGFRPLALTGRVAARTARG
jgi:hypothetical protein